MIKKPTICVYVYGMLADVNKLNSVRKTFILLIDHQVRKFRPRVKNKAQNTHQTSTQRNLVRTIPTKYSRN